jgi:anti-sigma factor RsiW
MNCHECSDQLQQFLDGETPADDFDAHLAVCKNCRALHAAARDLIQGLALWSPPSPRPDLADRIVRSVVRDRVQRRRRRWLMSAGAAAGIVIALSSAWWPKTVHPEPQPHQIAESDNRQPSLEENVQQAGQAIADLTRRTAVDTLQSGRTFLPSVELTSAIDPQVALPDLPAESRKAWSDALGGVSVGLEPLTNSARQAASFFRREVPLMNQEPGPGM